MDAFPSGLLTRLHLSGVLGQQSTPRARNGQVPTHPWERDARIRPYWRLWLRAGVSLGSSRQEWRWVLMCPKEDADRPTNGRNPSQQATRTRDHLANTRTLLAWVRTGVSLIGFGLVIERFAAQTDPTGVSAVFGVALAALGCMALVVGVADFVRTRRDIAEENVTAAASVGATCSSRAQACCSP